MYILILMLLITAITTAHLEYIDYNNSLSVKVFYRFGFLILTAIILGIYYFN